MKKTKKIKSDFENFLFPNATQRECFRRRLINSGKIAFLTAALFFSITLNSACTPRAFEKANAAAPSPTAEDKQADFQNELEKMRTANLQFIFAFRRKDDGAFDGEDKKYLRTNLPMNNRIVLADDDKAVIVGSNYKFPPENLDALRTRFNVEDYSANTK